MSKLKIGFVGTGGMGQCAHLRNYIGRQECEVTAISELRPKVRELVAARYGIARTYSSGAEMLQAEKLDAIVAVQNFAVHGQLLPELYQQNLPVLTEKPLARTVESGLALLESLAATGTKHYVAYHKRSDPATMYAVAKIREFQQSGEVGKMRSVRLTMPPGDWVQNGFLDLINTDDEYPNLAVDPPAPDMDEATFRQYCDFVNYYIHQVNLMRHLLGEDYSVSYADPKGLLMVAHSQSGVVGQLEMATWFTTVDWQESALVTFDRGWLRIDLPAPLVRNRPGRVTVFRDTDQGVETVTPSLPAVDAMRSQADNFLRALAGAETCLCQAEEAQRDLLIARDYIRMLKGQTA